MRKIKRLYVVQTTHTYEPAYVEVFVDSTFTPDEIRACISAGYEILHIVGVRSIGGDDEPETFEAFCARNRFTPPARGE